MSEARLRDRIEYLEAENANLRHELGRMPDIAMILMARTVFQIPPDPARLLVTLLDGRPHGREGLYDVLYGSRSDGPEIKILDVYVSRLRRGLGVHGIKIELLWGFGYQMTAENGARVLALISPEAKP